MDALRGVARLLVEEHETDHFHGGRLGVQRGQCLGDGIVFRPPVHAGGDQRVGDRPRAQVSGDGQRRGVAAPDLVTDQSRDVRDMSG